MTSDHEMRLNVDLTQQSLDAFRVMVRQVVREEIVNAVGALAREAEHQDMPYETGELESSALRVVRGVAEGALLRLTCPHETYTHWCGEPRCSRCGEPEPVPADPFKEDTHGQG